MRMRSALIGGLLIFIMVLGLAAPALAATEWHIGGPSGEPNTYADLDSFRAAVNSTPGLLSDGDIIVLHRDDDSLSGSFVIPNEWTITIRSASGGRYTITPNTSASYLFYNEWPYTSTKLTLENVHLVGDPTVYQTGLLLSTYDESSLTVSNSIFENLSYGIVLDGAFEANIVNTSFKNKNGIVAVSASNYSGETTNLNIGLNQNSADVVTWGGRPSEWYPNSMEIYANGEVNIDFNIAAGKMLDLENKIYGEIGANGAINIEKNGWGTLRLTGGWIDGDYGTNFVVNEGRVHFDSMPAEGSAIWYDPYGTILFKEDTTFKPTKSRGNLEEIREEGGDRWSSDSGYLHVATFNSEEGSKLEIGRISEYKSDSYSELGMGVAILSIPAVILNEAGEIIHYNSTIACTMKIDNQLLKATLEYGTHGDDGFHLSDQDTPSEDWNALVLRVDRIENLSILKGVGEYADVYRRLTSLTQAERDMLDDIYNRGGLNSNDRAFLQTLSGAIVTNSLLGMRHNWTNLLRKINRRTTDFQHEELQELMITGSEFCKYTTENPVVDYVQMWAGIDKSWMNQTDADSLAGYEYDPYGFHIGVERHCENLIVGGVVRFDDGTMKLKSNSSTKTDITTVIGSAYVSYATDGMYITGSVHAGYGWNESWSNYRMPGLASTAKTGSYGSTLFGAHVELGYMMETELGEIPFRVTPYGGLGYAKMHRQAVTESGGGNLDRHFRRGDWDLWEPSLGVRLAMAIDRGGYTLIPTADIAWTRTTGDGRNENGDANLIADPNAVWKISTMAGNRSALRFSGGLTAQFQRNLSVGMNYDFEWRSHYTSHQLNLNLSVGF